MTTTRQLAENIVAMRKLLMREAVANAAGDGTGAQEARLEQHALFNLWGPIQRVLTPLMPRVRVPMERKLDREGILAQRDWSGYVPRCRHCGNTIVRAAGGWAHDTPWSRHQTCARGGTRAEL